MTELNKGHLEQVSAKILQAAAQLVAMLDDPDIFAFGPATVEYLIRAYSQTRWMLGHMDKEGQ